MSNSEEQELKDRLTLIESMIAEGRRGTESWGWSFVLWGIAYYVAIAWATWGHSYLAWPVTMVATGVLTGVIASRRGDGGRKAETTVSRAIGAVWIAVGISLFIYGISAGVSGRADLQTFVAVIGVMLGTANAISSIILKWPGQFAAAAVWWVCAAASQFVTVSQCSVIFLTAIFLGQIVFGAYMMISEARERKAQSSGAAHA
jgi:hypothetical protein